MVVSPVIIIESLGHQPDEIISDVLSEEVSQVKDRGIILLGKPFLGLSLLFAAYVAGIATGYFLTSAKVLPQAVFEESL